MEERRGITPPFFTSALDGDEWSVSRPFLFIPAERDQVLFGYEAGWAHREEKNLALPEIEPGPSSP
jgi:hypothetical protein